MENEIFRARNYTAKVVRCSTAIVGSGAAGFNLSLIHISEPTRP